MKITKEEIRNEASRISKGIFTSTNAAADFETGFAEGVEYAEKRLEPLITELSMEKARRQPKVQQKVKEAVKIALHTAAKKALLHIARSPMGEAQIRSAYQDYSMRNDVTVYKQSILSLEQEILEKLNVKP